MGHKPRVPEAKFSNPLAPWPRAVSPIVRALRQARYQANEDRRSAHQRWVEDRRKAKRKRAQLAAAKAAGQPIVQPAQQDPGWFKAMLKALPSYMWASKATLRAEAELAELKLESQVTGKSVEDIKLAKRKKMLDEARAKRSGKA